MSPSGNRVRYVLWVPAAVLALVTILAWTTPLDRWLARFFYDGNGWPVGETAPFDFAYHYGQHIGFLPALAALAVLVAGFFRTNYAKWRRGAAFLLLLLAIGPGLLVNVVFKEGWNRPRPRETAEFGGSYAYLEPLAIGEDAPGKKSFPSGHVAMAFFFVAPYFILLGNNRRAALLWLAFGIAWGLFVGAARIAQGAHWASDVIWSFGMVYFTGYVLARVLRLDRMVPDEQSD
jgi:membrane-associated PAP2 superfamily phosphatase